MKETNKQEQGPFLKGPCSFSLKIGLPLLLIIFLMGCTRLFGWNIHAPGLLSQDYYQKIRPTEERVALYLPDHLKNFISKEKGGKLADPQTYFVGESLEPILIEAFQGAFREFLLVQTEPTPELMRQYDIPYLVVVNVGEFQNRVTLKGQVVGLRTEVWVFDKDLRLLGRIEAEGSSDAQKVFAKKGGPEVNLNAAIENNVTALTQFLQDFLGDL